MDCSAPMRMLHEVGAKDSKEKGRTLLYLCSLGASRFRSMTELCIRSLRGRGKYAGEILVFTNNGFRTRDPAVRTERAPDGLEKCAMFAFKAGAGKSIDASRYDKILFMDSDMLAVGDMNPFFEHSDDSLCAMEEVGWTRMNKPQCGATLRRREIPAARRRWGINTGLVCTPGKLFRDYMETWESEIWAERAKLKGWFDQSPMNALILRGIVRFKPYPAGWIEMPPMYFWFGGRFRLTKDTKVLHFCWGNKLQSLEEMEVLHGALNDAESNGK